ncbi:hypothetical protein H4582DRAFT_2061190 [Lactarius indigo]|nr:hypothetical protein H4582DRAFT_2061190 [Lactarius indigo]
MMISDLTLSSLAWLTASGVIHDIPSTVSEQASVGSGKMKGHHIRALRKVADEADLYCSCTTRPGPQQVGRGASARWKTNSCSCSTRLIDRSRARIRWEPHIMTPMIPFPTVDPDQPLLWYCTSNFLRPFETYKTSGSQQFIVGNRQPPERLRCSTLKRISAFCGVPVDGTYRTCPADSRPPNCIIVKGEGIPEQKWSKRKILMAPPPTMRSVSFFLSCLRSSNTLPPHVAEILLHMLAEVLMKAYNHSKFNTTSEFTKSYASFPVSLLSPIHNVFGGWILAIPNQATLYMWA